MQTKARILLSSFICLLVLTAYAQNQENYLFEFLNNEDGLSNNYTTKIVQDNKGLIWIATETGLDKYDGNNILVYSRFEKNTTSSIQNIETIYKNTKGDLWVGTKTKGLYYLDISEDKILAVELENSDNRVISIVETNQGKLLVGTWSKGLYVIDQETMTVETHLVKRGSFYELFKDSEGIIWAGTGGRLLRIDPISLEITASILNINGIISIQEDPKEGKLWLGSWRGLYSFDKINNTITSYTQFNNDLNVALPSLLFKKDELIIGTWGNGLFKLNPKSLKLEKINIKAHATDDLSNIYSVVLDLYEDNYGTIWASTSNGVVKIIRKLPFNLIINENVTQKKYTNTTSIFSSDELLLVGADKGIYVKFGKTSKHYQTGRVFNMVSKTEAEMYICTSDGLYVLNLRNQTIKRVLPELLRVTDVIAQNDTILWIATKQDGVYMAKVRNQSHVIENEFIANQENVWSLKSNRIECMVTDHLNRIWIGTYDGLYVYDSNNKNFIHINSILPDQNFFESIINDLVFSEEKLYAATASGLYIINLAPEMNMIHIKSDLGVSNNYLNALALDQDQNVWASTNFGINKYSYLNYAILNFNVSNGTYSNSFIEKAAFKDSEGIIYFGSDLGPVYFIPDSIYYKGQNAQIIFSNLKVNNKNVMVGDHISRGNYLEKPLEYLSELTLSHLDKVISITVSPDDFIESGIIFYKYRLVGFQDEWISSVNQNNFTYTNLDAGEYIFEVKTSRNRHVWREEANTLKIIVMPAPWRTWWAYSLYGILILAFLYLTYRILTRASVLRNKLKLEQIEKRKEKELTESKLRFFTNISHEFRSPLTLINGPIEDILANNKIDSEQRSKLDLVYKNSRRLLNLVNQLLEFRKIETGNEVLTVMRGNFVKFINEIYLSFKELAEKRNIPYTFHYSDSPIDLWFDRQKMEILMYNLLSNAFKYSDDGSEISILIKQDQSACILIVKDTGKGMTKKEQKHIFDRFYQVRNQESSKVMGSGIGLSLSKAIAESHSGSIVVESEKGRGSSFIFRIPKGSKHFSKNEIIKGKEADESLRQFVPIAEIKEETRTNPVEKTPDSKVALVVEDNPEIRSYVRSLIEVDFAVIEAEDGVQGLSIAKKEIPDIIVSDVMMPNMDGIELCKKIKQNESTSHIPVVLLTARTSNIYQLSGLETGADDYVTKPFAPEILRARVANLIASREYLKEYYSKKITLEASNIEIPDKEAEFLKKAINLVEENISNTEFGTKELQDALFMSQPTLYRKIKALTNDSPSAFIRSIRIKYAAELLAKGSLNVNEAIFDSGFNDVKYFRECFKKQFGCTPSKYIKMKKGD